MTAAARKRVLLVEDDKLLWTALQARMRGRGYELRVCTDGEEAIEALTHDPFDIVLLDLVLPGRDGYGVLMEKVNTMNRNTPVLVITNLREPAHIQKAVELGAKRCYAKATVSLTTLIEDMARLLGER